MIIQHQLIKKLEKVEKFIKLIKTEKWHLHKIDEYEMGIQPRSGEGCISSELYHDR